MLPSGAGSAGQSNKSAVATQRCMQHFFNTGVRSNRSSTSKVHAVCNRMGVVDRSLFPVFELAGWGGYWENGICQMSDCDKQARYESGLSSDHILTIRHARVL